MEDRSHALIAIAFLALFGIGAALVAWWMLAPATSRVPYLLESQASVAGLGPGSPVNYRGVQVGGVRKVALDPRKRQVDVTIAVNKDFPLPVGTYATISSQGLIGNKAIELQLGESTRTIETSPGAPAHLPLREGSLAGLMNEAAAIVAEVRTTLHSLQQLLSEQNRQELSATLVNIKEASARLVALEKAAQPAVRQMPELLARTRSALASAQQLINAAERLVGASRVPVRALGRAASSAGAAIAGLSQTTAPQLDALLVRLRALSGRLDRLARQLERSPQSLILGPPPPSPGPGERGAGG